MAILLNKDSRVLVQGITGNIGSFSAELMLKSGTNVVAGVTPGKGGQQVHGIPVFNSVNEAKSAHKVNASFVVVPPLFVKSAVFEALDSEIKLVVVFSENVPIHDSACMIAKAKEKGAILVGPASVGVLCPGFGRMGPIGGFPDMVERIYKSGSVGVISKSGGMTNETAWVVRQAGLGQSSVIGIGGEVLVGSSFVDLLKLFEKDVQTKAVAIFGELGGTYEDEVAQALLSKEFTKPLVVFVAGKFTEKLPQGIQFGHAGAIIERGRGKPSDKLAMLKKAGALIASKHEDIGKLLRGVL